MPESLMEGYVDNHAVTQLFIFKYIAATQVLEKKKIENYTNKLIKIKYKILRFLLKLLLLHEIMSKILSDEIR